MQKITFFLFLIFATTTGFSQADSLRKDSTEPVEVRNNYQDSMDRAVMNRNLNVLVEMQKERARKERQQMYIRIAVGIFFLVILVIGLSRKRKQKDNKA